MQVSDSAVRHPTVALHLQTISTQKLDSEDLEVKLPS